MMRGNQERFKKKSFVALEAFLIVFGVFVAMWANDWHQKKENREHAQRARTSILLELENNRKAVEASRDYHWALMGQLRAFSKEQSEKETSQRQSPSIQMFSKGFVLPAPVLTTAWDAAKETGALRYMDYRDVLAFSEIYAKQERYQHQGISFSGVIYSAMFQGGSSAILEKYPFLMEIIGGFWFKEQELTKFFHRKTIRFNQIG